MDELSSRVVNEYDVVGITESWGTSDVTDAELNLPGFHLFRADRHTRGGGVLLYVSESLNAIRLDDFDSIGFSDSVWCKVTLSSIKLIVDGCLIMGDFNLPGVDFGTFSVDGADDSFAAQVFDCVMDNYWTQHVRHPTRFRGNQTPSCLDWIITDDPDVLEELNYSVPIGKSDHVCLSWLLSYNKLVSSAEKKFNYWKADYTAIRAKFSSIDWVMEFDDKSVNDTWNQFSHIIADTVKEFVPLYKHFDRERKSPWISSETRKLIRKRRKAWSLYTMTRSAKSFVAYKKFEIQWLVASGMTKRSTRSNW